MNFVHIVGRLAKDPETRYTSSNQKVTTLVVASNSFRNGQEETIWWRVTLWGDRFDKMVAHLTKGKLVMVGGEMRKPEIYRDKAGSPQVGSIEVNAEYLKFVPIGRADGQGNAADGQGNAHESRPAPAHQEASRGFDPMGAGASYGAAARQDSNVSFDHDEEPLPF